MAATGGNTNETKATRPALAPIWQKEDEVAHALCRGISLTLEGKYMSLDEV